jgi:hypothetical protein
MNIDSIRIKAVESARACTGCMFIEQPSYECVALCKQLAKRGLPDCEDKAPSGKEYIYVLDESDPRQMTLLEGNH